MLEAESGCLEDSTEGDDEAAEEDGLAAAEDVANLKGGHGANEAS